jgi:hypothetical protein
MTLKFYNVTGINIDKAAIAYRLESVYLSANSTYANARTYGIQSATYTEPGLQLSPLRMHFMQ